MKFHKSEDEIPRHTGTLSKSAYIHEVMQREISKL